MPRPARRPSIEGAPPDENSTGGSWPEATQTRSDGQTATTGIHGLQSLLSFYHQTIGKIRLNRIYSNLAESDHKYGLTNRATRRILAIVHRRRSQTSNANAFSYGVAVDLAFLTEMSNLSPPIIHPPPSYFRTAPPHLAGQFSFGRLPTWRSERSGRRGAAPGGADRCGSRLRGRQLALASTQDQAVDQIGKLTEVPAFLRNVGKRRVSVHHAIAEPPGVRVFRV